MKATELLYAAAGCPEVEGWEEVGYVEVCYLCGGDVPRGVPVKKRLRGTWTGHDTAVAPWSQWLCQACMWSMSEKATHSGRERPFKMRAFSHLVQGDEWRVLGLGDKVEMGEILLVPPESVWLLAICDKPLAASHILYRTQVNLGEGDWIVSLGGRPVAGSPARLAEVWLPVERLYRGGHTKRSILSGRYKPKEIMKDEAGWAMDEARISVHRGKPIFTLAVFLAQKEQEKEL